MKIEISIIIPIHNRSSYLQEILVAFEKQSSQQFEVIIVDDHSSETEAKEIKKLCDDYTFAQYFPQVKELKGAPAARNYGAKLAQNDYLFFLDSDDLISSEFIDHRVRSIQQDPMLDLWIFPVQLFNKIPGDSNIMWNEFNEKNDLLRFLNTDTVWHTSGPIWRKSFFNKLEGFNKELTSWQDWEIHIRALLEHPKYKKYQQKPDIYYRKHSDDAISKNSSSPSYFKNQLFLSKKVLQLLIKGNNLPKQWKYYFAKLVFNFHIKAEQNNIDCSPEFIELITKNKLVSKFQLSIWHKRIKSRNSLLNKLIDKVQYVTFKDHFLETKTTFLNTKWK